MVLTHRAHEPTCIATEFRSNSQLLCNYASVEGYEMKSEIMLSPNLEGLTQCWLIIMFGDLTKNYSSLGWI